MAVLWTTAVAIEGTGGYLKTRGSRRRDVPRGIAVHPFIHGYAAR